MLTFVVVQAGQLSRTSYLRVRKHRTVGYQGNNVRIGVHEVHIMEGSEANDLGHCG